MRARVIGLGQPAAGDDGVGLAVLQSLRQRGPLPDVELLEVADDLALVPLLETESTVVLVDAVAGDTPGNVVVLTPEELACRDRGATSTHGIGVAQAIALARVLADGVARAPVRIVAVTIRTPTGYGYGLSPAVAAAVPVAARRVLALLGG